MINFPRSTHAGWHPSPSYPRDPPKIAASDSIAGSAAGRGAAGVLASGWMTNGPEVAAFETEFAEQVGASCAIAVSSGSTAIELSLRSLHLPRRSRVLVSTLAPNSVVQAILRAALQPVLLDVSEDTGMPTPEHLREVVDGGVRPVRAMVVAHWSGDPCDVEALAQAAGIPPGAMVEDASQALGARYDGRAVGGAGSACFSFYSTANLPIGDGGMVTTDDTDRAALLLLSRVRATSPAARHHVRRGHIGPHVLPEGGLESSLTEQSAATGRALLRRLPSWQRRRQALADRYDAELAGIPGVSLPHRPIAGRGEHAWHFYPVRIERSRSERDALVRALAAAGVGTAAPVQPLHRVGYCREVCGCRRPTSRVPTGSSTSWCRCPSIHDCPTRQWTASARSSRRPWASVPPAGRSHRTPLKGLRSRRHWV